MRNLMITSWYFSLILIGVFSMPALSHYGQTSDCESRLETATNKLNKLEEEIMYLKRIMRQQKSQIELMDGQSKRQKDISTETPYRRKILPNNSGAISPAKVNELDIGREEPYYDINSSFELRRNIWAKLNRYPSTLAHTVEFVGHTFHTFVIDLRAHNHELKIFCDDGLGGKYKSIDNVQNKVQVDGGSLVFATNGGIFDQGLVPKGLFIQDGMLKGDVDARTNGYGNFYIMPNGIFSINESGKASIVPTDVFAKINKDEIVNAIQSGPMLLVGGKYNESFNEHSDNKRIRSGVGIIDDNRIVFAISKSEVSFYDFAKLFKEIFDCKNALYLDGGISKMYCPELGLHRRGGEFSTIIGLVK